METFCQKFIQCIQSNVRLNLLKIISPQFVSIASHSCGTHALQRFLDMISQEEERVIIIQSVIKSVHEMAMDHEATHVLQKIIAEFKDDDVKELIQKLISNLVMLTQNAYGICVVKRVIEKIGPSEEMKQIIELIASHLIEIAQSSFGNYAIQHALEKWKFAKCKPIFEEVLKNFPKLSIQRFSSNVVEKFILESDTESLVRILLSLQDESKMQILISNKFGNYVLNKLSSKLKGDDFKKLESLIVEASKKVKPYVTPGK